MIIVGYQGIGKSTLAGKQRCIDLESGNFFVANMRPEGWERIYCNIAEHLSDQGYTVFISSHKEVRNTLSRDLLQGTWSGKVFCIYPSHELKFDWIAKLGKRYFDSRLSKDYRAYVDAVDCYDDNIRDIAESGFTEVVIEDMNYSLSDIVYSLQVNH